MIEPIDDPAVVAGYLTDASNVRGHASALVRPRTAAEVSEVVRHCQSHGVPLTVSAGRTATTAAAVPMGGWVLSTEHLDRVLHVGTDTARAEAGVVLGAFQRQVEAAGRFYPPDPTSRNDCTLGASIATNASGARSYRYGPTRRWIEALTVVLPTGAVLEVGPDDPLPAGWPTPTWRAPAVKTAAGYHPAERLLDLFIGQEGTLGVVVDATVRLLPLPPWFPLLVFFRSRRSAVDFVRRVRAGALAPRSLEYLDHHCLDLARVAVGEVPEEATCALLCEQEGTEALLPRWLEVLTEAGALAEATLVATDPAGQARMQAFRHAIPAGINEQMVRAGMPKIGTDLSVPDEALDTVMDAYEATTLPHVLFGHIGDNHLHLNILPRDAAELSLARARHDELAALAISLGGSVSAEHGIGKLKRAHLARMVGPETLAAFRRLKAHLDPAWILGRGNILDPEAPVRSEEQPRWSGE